LLTCIVPIVRRTDLQSHGSCGWAGSPHARFADGIAAGESEFLLRIGSPSTPSKISFTLE
jgi:hypothetical protein